MRRVRGSGAVYQRASDGLWVARVTLDTGKRKVFYGNDRDTAGGKMRAWMAEHRPEALQLDPYGRRGRAAHMANARAIGTHTAEEWVAKQAEQGHRCFYCDEPVDLGGVKDHYVPVSRGGSDAIENIVLACWQCNEEKADALPLEFLAWVALTDWFNQRPRAATRFDSRGYRRRFTEDQIEFLRTPQGQRAAWLARWKKRRGDQ